MRTVRSLFVTLAVATVALQGCPGYSGAATDPSDCGSALPRFRGALCGPPSNPCIVVRDEVIAGSAGFRNDGPDLAVDSHDDARILYPLAEGGFFGFLIAARQGEPFEVEAIEPVMAVGALALDPHDVPYALINDGYFGYDFWRRDHGWQRLYHSFAQILAGRPGSLRRDDAGCFHAGATINEAPAYLRLADNWTFHSLTTETGTEPVLALAPSGQPHLAYFTTGGASAELFWAAPPGAPEPVLSINTRGRLRYPAALAVTASDADATGTPHLLTRQYSPDQLHAAIVHAVRRSDGGWEVQTLAEESGLDPYALCPTCPGEPLGEDDTCSCSYAAVLPLAVIANGADAIRMFYARYDVSLDLHAYCNARPQIVCEWSGTRAVNGSIIAAWPDRGGFARQTVLEGVVPGDASAVLDSRGRVHLAMTDRQEIRYVLLEGAAAEACPTDCSLDGAVSVEELVTGIRIALGANRLDECPAADFDLDGRVGIDELLRGVAGALHGCRSRRLPSVRYALDGTLNGSPATGVMVLRALSVFGPNVLRYSIESFTFSALSGSGTAELFTLDNSFTVNVSAGFPEQAHVALNGSARFLSIGPLSFDQFRLAAPGFELAFTASADTGVQPARR